MKLAKSKKGFTLIELVMVIVILGILAAVAVPKFADITGDAQMAVFSGDLAQVNGGISIKQAQNLIADPSVSNGGYPLDLEDATTLEFSEVIQGGIADRWNVTSAATAFGTVAGQATGTSEYTFIDNDTTAVYDNFLGSIVKN